MLRTARWSLSRWTVADDLLGRGRRVPMTTRARFALLFGLALVVVAYRLWHLFTYHRFW